MKRNTYTKAVAAMTAVIMFTASGADVLAAASETAGAERQAAVSEQVNPDETEKDSLKSNIQAKDLLENSFEDRIPPMAGYVPGDMDRDVSWLDKSYTPGMIDEMLSDGDGYADGQPDTDDIAEGESEYSFEAVPSAPAEELPAAYPYAESDDLIYYLRDTLPAQRDQNPVGDCWAHSAIALMEIYKEKNDAYLNGGDFSESHLVHYTYATGDNPNTDTDEDTIVIKKGDEAAPEHIKFLMGGDLASAASTLLHWKGAVDDNGVYAPVHSFEGEGNVKKKNANIAIDSFDWSADGNQSGHNEKVLKEYYTINIRQNPEYVKHWIREHGAVGISYYSLADEEPENNYYKSNEGIDAYYYNGSEESNHAVTVVGWDDNYSKDNFRADVKPENNGAWLCRNSWSSDLADIKDFYSYFWLSYEDKGLEDAAFAYVPESVDPSVHRYDYYYDLEYCNHGFLNYDDDTDFLSANIYKNQSGKDECLDSVNFLYQYKEDSISHVSEPRKAIVYVYTDLTDKKDPTSGKKIKVGEQIMPFTGQYSLDLKKSDDRVIIKKNSSFSVVIQTFNRSVSYETNNNKTYTVMYDVDEAGKAIEHNELTGKITVAATVGGSAGESMYNYVATGASIDTAEPSGWTDSSTAGNFIIGACTTDVDDIATKDIAYASFTLTDTTAESIIYKNAPHTPGFTVRIGSATLIKDKDYTIEYKDNINAGTAKAVFTGKGEYTGTKTAEFTILPLDLGSKGFTAVLDQEEFEFDGDEKKPGVSVKYDNDGLKLDLKENDDYTVEYTDNTDAGTGKCKITGKGNFAGSQILEFTILGTDINSEEISVTVEDGLVYDGTEKKPGVTVTKNGTALKEDEDYEVIYAGLTNVGEAELTINGKGIYFGTRSAKYSIAPADISGQGFSIVLSQDKYTADKTAKTPNVTLYWNQTALKADTDYKVAYSDNVEYGTAKVTVTGKGNFKGTQVATFTIEKGIESVDKTEPVVVDVGGETVSISSAATYANTIEYMGKKVTPVDLGLEVDITDLVALADKLKTKDGDVSKVFSITYTKLQNSTNAGSEASFVTKIVFNKKKAKKLGISTANRNDLKKAVAALNAEFAKDPQKFTITKVNIRDNYVNVSASFTKKNKLKFKWLKVKVNNKNRKLKKKKEFKVVGNPENKTLTITGCGKNYEGIMVIDLTTKQIVGP